MSNTLNPETFCCKPLAVVCKHLLTFAPEGRPSFVEHSNAAALPPHRLPLYEQFTPFPKYSWKTLGKNGTIRRHCRIKPSYGSNNPPINLPLPVNQKLSMDKATADTRTGKPKPAFRAAAFPFGLSSLTGAESSCKWL
ncbi:MAG: hypothetical protein NZL93_00105 [Chthoniobacterales bacterium]|nr:hypothetical protein [Chthoniobacterales bacterium]